jgi:hypothetical protein
VWSHLTTWQHLVGERGWAPEDYKERSIRSIKAEILTPDGASKRRRAENREFSAPREVGT